MLLSLSTEDVEFDEGWAVVLEDAPGILTGLEFSGSGHDCFLEFGFGDGFGRIQGFTEDFIARGGLRSLDEAEWDFRD